MEGILGTISANYVVALIAGLVFIGFFAWDRLNVRVPEDVKTWRQKRFIDLLEPSKFVQTQIFVRAWLLYFFLLSTIYATFCFLAKPLITVLGALGTDTIGFDQIAHTDPAMPLFISLIITGLLPQFPVMKRLEEVARRLALRVVGIPETFNDLTDALFEEPLPPTLPAQIQTEIIDRTKTAVEASQRQLDPQRIENGLTKIHAFLQWIGDRQPWPGTNVFDQFSAIHADINGRARAILEDIQDLAERSDLESDPVVLRQRWIELAKRLEAVTDDVCALIAILSENAPRLPGTPGGFQSIVSSRAFPAMPREAGGPEQQALRKYIVNARRRRSNNQVEFVWLMINTVCLSLAMFLVGVLGGYLQLIDYKEIEIEGPQRMIAIGAAWFIGTLLTYGPAALMAWNFRLRANNQGRWMDVLQDWEPGHDGPANRPVDYLRMYGSLLIKGWVISSLCLGLMFVVQSYMRAADPTLVLTEFQRSSQGYTAIIYGALGGVYATGMVRFFDLRDLTMHHPNTTMWVRRSIPLACILSATLFLVCLGGSILVFALTTNTFGPSTWETALYQAFAAGMFGAVASAGTILAFKRMNLVQKRRLDIRSRRAQGPFKAEVAE